MERGCATSPRHGSVPLPWHAAPSVSRRHPSESPGIRPPSIAWRPRRWRRVTWAGRMRCERHVTARVGEGGGAGGRGASGVRVGAGRQGSRRMGAAGCNVVKPWPGWNGGGAGGGARLGKARGQMRETSHGCARAGTALAQRDARAEPPQAAHRLLSCGGGPAGAQHGCSASRGLDRGRASAPLRLLPRTSGPRLSRCGGRLWARGPEPADAIHGCWVRVGGPGRAGSEGEWRSIVRTAAVGTLGAVACRRRDGGRRLGSGQV